MQYVPSRVTNKRAVDVKKCPDPNAKYPAIGKKLSAETLFPEGYPLQDKAENYLICDYPGFEGNRESTVQLELIATQVAVKTTQSIRGIIFVVSWKSFEDPKLIELEKELEVLGTMFKNPREKLPAINLVISHLPEDGSISKKDILKTFRNFLAHKLEQQPGQQTSSSQNLEGFLEFILEHPDQIIMFDPMKNDAREQLFRNLKKSVSFPATEMSLVSSQTRRNEFLREMLKVLSEGEQIFKRLLALPEEIQAQKNKQAELGELIKQTTIEIAELDGGFFNLLLMLTSSAIGDLDLEKLSNGRPIIVQAAGKHYIYGLNQEKKWMLNELPDEMVSSVSLTFPPIDEPAQLIPFGKLQQNFYQSVMAKKLHCHEPDTDKELEKLKQIIAQKKEAIRNIEEEFKAIETTTIPALRKEIGNINRKTQLVVSQTLEYSEENTFGKHRKRGERNRKELTYHGDAFSQTKSTAAPSCAGSVDEQGRFEGEEVKAAEGHYKVTYLDPNNCYGYAKVEILTEERFLPQNRQKLDDLSKEVVVKEADVVRLKAQVVLFADQLKQLELQYTDACVKLAINKLALKKSLVDAKKILLQTYNTNQTVVVNEIADKTIELGRYEGNLTQNAELYHAMIKLQSIVQFEIESFPQFEGFFRKVLAKYSRYDFEDFDDFDAQYDNVEITVNEFHLACINGDVNQVKQIIKANDRLIDEKNSQGLNALEWLVESNSQHLEVIKDLLLAGSSCSDRYAPKLLQIGHPLSAQFPDDKDQIERRLKIIKLRMQADYDSSDESCGPNSQQQEFVPAEDSRHVGGLVPGANGASRVFYSVVDPLQQVLDRSDNMKIFGTTGESRSSSVSMETINAEPSLLEDSDTASPINSTAIETLSAQPSLLAGKWDQTIYKDQRTGAPIFVYRAYDTKGHEVGSMSFYQHPILCRSENGERHNIIASTGIFERVTIKADTLEEVCAALPQTLFDSVVSTAQQSAMYGGVRGIANVVGYTLAAKQVPTEITQAIQKAVGLTGYFLLRFNHHLSNALCQEAPNILDALVHSAIDTGSILITGMVLDKVCGALQYMGRSAKDCGWTRAGQVFSFFGNHGNKAMYGVQAFQQGVVETVTAVASGNIVERVVETTGTGIARWTLNGSSNPVRMQQKWHQEECATDTNGASHPTL